MSERLPPKWLCNWSDENVSSLRVKIFIVDMWLWLSDPKAQINYLLEMRRQKKEHNRVRKFLLEKSGIDVGEFR